MLVLQSTSGRLVYIRAIGMEQDADSSMRKLFWTSGGGVEVWKGAEMTM